MTDHGEILRRAAAGELSEADETALADRVVEALRLYDRHVQLGMELQDANGDEIKALQAVCRYLSQTAIPPWMTMPFWLRITDLRAPEFRESSASLPEAQLWPKTFASAAISQYKILHLRTISDAAKHVAKLTGFDHEMILAFRKRTIDEREKGTVRRAGYDHYLEYFKSIPAEDFEATVFVDLAQISAIPAEKKRAHRK
ncbi:hypothetical protein [Mesorhizobium sp. NZP2077]|uniref:hypothetical protein n=1 Tax=Mesorhizobium sp. NZP2077 TaxID=2483404 RepID=UPI001556A633|nr:hypothetical protein [Mesorhizobium sp. NZP2077]QKC83940.1 hypothetical protein EB232_22180 [Mesorhizobium sp. NZP2077]QKD17477.1 hypothetical protein HGP13_21885 [Mesorhizobium sp. NZP2077]